MGSDATRKAAVWPRRRRQKYAGYTFFALALALCGIWYYGDTEVLARHRRLTETGQCDTTHYDSQRGEALFPVDLFDPCQKAQGAILLHVLGIMYMFIGLAIICDEFFEPALEALCEALGIGHDVAGATFMAAGGSAPELATSIIGVFFAKNDIGFGTIVGSAVFNVLFVIAICAWVCPQLKLTWWPLTRDSSYYCISILVLVVFVNDQQIVWHEALILFLMYLGYVIFMKFNEPIKTWMQAQVNRDVKKTEDDYPRWRVRLQEFTTSTEFILFMYLVIAVDVTSGIWLSVQSEGQEATFVTTILQIGAYVCIAIYFVEAGLKILATGPFIYVRDPWNAIDAVLIFLIMVEWIVESSTDANNTRYMRTVKLVKFLRFGRLIRILRTLWSAKSEKSTQTYPEDFPESLIDEMSPIADDFNFADRQVAEERATVMQEFRASVVKRFTEGDGGEGSADELVRLAKEAHADDADEKSDRLSADKGVGPDGPQQTVKVAPKQGFQALQIMPLAKEGDGPQKVSVVGGQSKLTRGKSQFQVNRLPTCVLPVTEEDCEGMDNDEYEGCVMRQRTRTERRTTQVQISGLVKSGIGKKRASLIPGHQNKARRKSLGIGETITHDIKQDDSDSDDDDEGPVDPFDIPDGCFGKIYWLVSLPMFLMMFYTIPDVKKAGMAKWYPLSFALCILWIAALSWFMVWMAQEFGWCVGISDPIMGLTLLAAGTSIPDALSSLAVAKRGYGDMAVSSSIGSNIFDILVGLAVPWLIKTAVHEPGSSVAVGSDGLPVMVLTLLLMVIAVAMSIHICGWQLTRKLGWIFMGLYGVFMTISLMVENGMLLGQ